MIAIGGYNQRIIQRDALRLATASVAATIKSPGRGRGGGREQVEVDRNNNNNKNRSSKNSKRSIVSKFNRSAKAEAIVGIALLAAVALLVNTGTPRERVSRSAATTTTINKYFNHSKCDNSL